MKLLITILFVCIALVTTQKSYLGYKTVDVYVSSYEDARILNEIMNSMEEIHFLKYGVFLNQINKLAVSPTQTQPLLEILSKNKIYFKVVDYDLQKQIDEERELIKTLKSKSPEINLDNYNSLQDIYKWVDNLPSKCPKGFKCKTYKIGESFEKKTIKAFKIEKENSQGRPSWYMDSTTHAREWISIATLLKIINHIIKYEDVEAKKLLDKNDFYFVPLVNPDGYDHSFTKERLWRKNRNNKVGKCIGVDLNRNFNSTNWGKEGASAKPCMETFMGEAGGSEPETKAVSEELKKISKVTKVALTLHSYGNMYLLPFGNTIKFNGDINQCEKIKDHNEIMVPLNAMADATQAVYNTKWKRGNACEVIYPTTGSLDDYTKGNLNIKYSICAELRGKNFVVPPAEIDSSFKEIFKGIIVLNQKI